MVWIVTSALIKSPEGKVNNEGAETVLIVSLGRLVFNNVIALWIMFSSA